MSLTKVIAAAQFRVEEAARGDEWWNSLSLGQQKSYVKKFPNSKYKDKVGKKATGGGSPTSKPGNPPKKRGTVRPGSKKKKVDPANPGGNAKPKPKKKVDPKEKPSAKKPTGKKPASKKPTGRKGRPKKVLSPAEKRKAIARRKQKIKQWEKRLNVLDKERGYRQAAMAYTQNPSTKKRLQERMKKITQMKKKVQERIKKTQEVMKKLAE